MNITMRYEGSGQPGGNAVGITSSTAAENLRSAGTEWLKITFPSYRSKLTQQSDDEEVDILLVPSRNVEFDGILLDEHGMDHFYLEQLFALYEALKDRHILEQAERLASWLSKKFHPFYLPCSAKAASAIREGVRTLDNECGSIDAQGTGDAQDINEIRQLKQMVLNNPDSFSFSVTKFVERLERLYVDALFVNAAQCLLMAKYETAEQFRRKLLEHLDSENAASYLQVPLVSGSDEEMRQDETEQQMEAVWSAYLKEATKRLPVTPVRMVFSDSEGRFLYDICPENRFDEAYFNLTQLVTNGKMETKGWQVKPGAAICECCGRMFYRNGARQRYCDRLACQQDRANKKSRAYYRRKKEKDSQ